MNNCILCLNKTLKKNSVSIAHAEEEGGFTVEDAIKEHFWFFEKILAYSRTQKSALACRSCWKKLEGFHEFFISVKFNHKADEQSDHEGEDEQEIKIEILPSSILIKSEVDEDGFVNVEGLEGTVSTVEGKGRNLGMTKKDPAAHEKNLDLFKNVSGTYWGDESFEDNLWGFEGDHEELGDDYNNLNNQHDTKDHLNNSKDLQRTAKNHKQDSKHQQNYTNEQESHSDDHKEVLDPQTGELKPQDEIIEEYLDDYHDEVDHSESETLNDHESGSKSQINTKSNSKVQNSHRNNPKPGTKSQNTLNNKNSPQTTRKSLRKRSADFSYLTMSVKKPKIPKNPPRKLTEEEKLERLKSYELTPEEVELLRAHTEIKCEKCEGIFNSWAEIRTHYRLTHKVEHGYVRCCGRKLDRITELKEHIAWHVNPHIFQCHICGKCSISSENLKLHEQMHIPDEERKFSCEICEKKFVNRYNLNMHMKQVHDKDDKEATIPCPYCDRFYKTERQLKTHTDYSHKDPEKNFICHICSKVLKTKTNLEIHVKAHTNPDEPVKCDLCGFILKNKRRFAIHMSKHKSALNGPYECEKGCGRIFKHRHAMLHHISFVHNSKLLYKCSQCEKAFKKKQSLEEHEAVHAGTDLYSCPFCDRTFRNSGNMHSHKKRAHPEEYKNLPAPSYLGEKKLGDIPDANILKNEFWTVVKDSE